MVFLLASVSEIQAVLGQRLRRQRLSQGWTQRDLADRSGVALGTVRHLESTGSCTLESLIRIIQCLGLVHELEGLFELKHGSIAQMQAAEQVQTRQRAPRKTP